MPPKATQLLRSVCQVLRSCDLESQIKQHVFFLGRDINVVRVGAVSHEPHHEEDRLGEMHT